MKKIIILIILLLIIFCSALFFFFRGAGTEYQHDADIVRLHHIEYYGNLIEEYFEKTGYYPLTSTNSNDNQAYVVIATNSQDIAASDYISHIPYEVTAIDDELFFKEIEEVLGRDVEKKYDPQTQTAFLPNFYVYNLLLDDGIYNFNVSTYYNYGVGIQLSDTYTKLEITNNPNSRQGYLLQELLADSNFQQARDATPLRDYFIEQY